MLKDRKTQMKTQTKPTQNLTPQTNAIGISVLKTQPIWSMAKGHVDVLDFIMHVGSFCFRCGTAFAYVEKYLHCGI